MPNKIPTNIITGFLGAGKTTTILHLLEQKPVHEKWVVLVNEFGEIGIDGAMMTEQGAWIKEVPGGCLCCTAGVPMSVALTALLREQPDRLLIEPTGLGHPKEVIAKLIAPQYIDYVELKATVALVDARQLSDENYTRIATFNDQLDCADIVMMSKADMASDDDNARFAEWITQQTPVKLFSGPLKQGQLPLELLDMPRIEGSASTHIDSHHHEHALEEPQFVIPPGEAFIRRENQADGFYSCGWLFGAEYEFTFDDIFSVFNDLTAERVKAVVNTDEGCYAFNVSDGVVSVNELSLTGFETRIEVIDRQLMPWDDLEALLLCLAGVTTPAS
ncbi:CobW family GTP-binding protein [Vibrio palustris]|uniref:Putative GTP-binding protein YjiA n=1 Tax=Vibrio palustris TaxID=1918946 RepID=A0A1R4B4T8_9VIBR|nr:GTP-binding protein [Vibrio palustris]SJL83919.1 putative GTP-binding protein YjiA [Vibrio palustris]